MPFLARFRMIINAILFILMTQGLSASGLVAVPSMSTREPGILHSSTLTAFNVRPSPRIGLDEINNGGHGRGRLLSQRHPRPSLFMRGGASIVVDEEDVEKERIKRTRAGMTVALFATHFTVMGAKVGLPCCLAMLTSQSTGLTFSSSKGTPQEQFARILGLSTMAIAGGKLVLGPLIDRVGGIFSLRVALAFLTTMLGCIALGQHISVFAICWILVDFIFSACWAGCLNAVHQSFPEEDWSTKVGILAVAARSGNCLAFLIFGTLLSSQMAQDIKQPWRLVFWVSAAMQLVPLTLLTYFGNRISENNNGDAIKTVAMSDSESEKYGDDKAHTLQSILSPMKVLRSEIGKLEFWQHLISRACLMVFSCILLFVPTLMNGVYGMNSADAARTGAVFAGGCMLSLSLSSNHYGKLTRLQKASTLASLLGLSTCCALTQWAHMVGRITLSASASVLSMFLWGFGFAIPFYIPPSLYALKRGGRVSSATIADCFDFVGFSCVAVFNRYMALIDHSIQTAW
eukprot:CAMPEP_0198303582 /NCGR_PEP_ID=MMETSP1449-20131203/56961_1 /TAXON_ID=420275 /ORGANISM="Attheya septentrionalis, Strain CCMP2084" /LENGTH=515 /DNA_ID=CAMNT_0044006077 /DNA_START=250 /DNA_END=1794 /DNA_ORIENTATION=-